jgi:hypothetical protein
MKNSSLIIVLTLLLIPFFAGSQTQGTLSVSTTTSSAGGNYAPRNIVAVWVTDTAGTFVKTLLAYAANRRTHLNTWEAATTAAGSAFNITDAISGPTRTSHGTRTCSWNGRNFHQLDMPDGKYRIWFELTDKNSTGNYSYYDFVKGPLPDIQAPTNVSSFSGISLAWQPSAVGYTDQTGHSGPHYLFDPGQRLLRISDNDDVQVMLYDLGGRLLYSGRDHTIDLKSFPSGLVVLKLKYDTTLYTAKLLLD